MKKGVRIARYGVVEAAKQGMSGEAWLDRHEQDGTCSNSFPLRLAFSPSTAPPECLGHLCGDDWLGYMSCICVVCVLSLETGLLEFEWALCTDVLVPFPSHAVRCCRHEKEISWAGAHGCTGADVASSLG